LEHLVRIGADIVGVCTLRNSKINSDYADLSNICNVNKIPLFYVENINSESTIAWIQNQAPDIIFCFGWSRLIGRDLLKLTPLGIVGFHPAMLPENRGRHPIIWSLVLGLKKTASTFFFMNEGVDSGDILSQEEILIDHQDDARTLYEKVTRTALSQISDFLPHISTGSFKLIKQNENLANIWRKRVASDGLIDWRMSAESIYNLVRGLAEPYVGAHFLLNGKEIKLWKVSIVQNFSDNFEPGKILLRSRDLMVIKCGVGAISFAIADPILNDFTGDYL
jgi:methionyl-tRNA formyltransferase